MNSSQRGDPNPGTPASPAAGKGMPAREPREQGARPRQNESMKEGAVDASLELPHERDQAVDMTDSKPNPVIEQADLDVQRGVKDTSKSVEMDRAYKKL